MSGPDATSLNQYTLSEGQFYDPQDGTEPEQAATDDQKPANWIPRPTHPLRHPRRIRVATIGAGFGGLMLAHNFQHKYKLTAHHVEHVIFEKNPDLGGTWYENTYPGVACDVPAHMYTFHFAPNPDWSEYYASGAEIQAYIKRTAERFDLARDVRFNHELREAEWNEAAGVWELVLELKKPGGGMETIRHTAEVLVDCSGVLSKPRWLDGADKEQLKSTFRGTIVHSAEWTDDIPVTGRRVAVVGNGSSAVQIVPALHARIGPSGQLYNFIRNATWLTQGFVAEHTRDGDGLNFRYTESEKAAFRADPTAHREYRRRLEHSFNHLYHSLLRGSTANLSLTRLYTQNMRARLNHDPELCAKLIPEYELGCRRVSPGEGYLETLTQPNVRAVFEGVRRVTREGIETTSGEAVELDVIVLATGFDVSYIPRWRLVGRDGAQLRDLWEDVPRGYMSMCAPRMPNYFLLNGPNACVGHGSLVSAMTYATDYMARWVRKIAEENIKSIVVPDAVIDDWNVYAQEMMRETVWTGGCRSWYKNKRAQNVLTAVYPGSIPNFIEMTSDLRAEDFEIRYRGRNRFEFMGDGLTKRETEGGDMAWYL